MVKCGVSHSGVLSLIPSSQKAKLCKVEIGSLLTHIHAPASALQCQSAASAGSPTLGVLFSVGLALVRKEIGVAKNTSAKPSVEDALALLSGLGNDI